MKFFFKSILIIICVLVTSKVSAFSNTPIAKKYEVPILVYHSIGPVPKIKESKMQTHYRVTTENFEKQMQFLKDNGYQPITFKKLVNSFNNYVMKLPEKSVVITFDDGWKNQYDNARPILEKYNFSATFFITTGYVNYKAYMNWDDLKYLSNHNFEIASHTKSHQVSTKIHFDKLQSELAESKKILENKLGIKISTLAYPNYAENEVVHQVVKTAGYFGARGGWANFKNGKDHIYELKSQEVVNNPDPFSEKRLPDLP